MKVSLALICLAFLASAGAEARTLTCKIAGGSGLYRDGQVQIEESNGLTVHHVSAEGKEETIMGGGIVCGQETKAFQFAPECRANFTNPTPLKKLVVLCRQPKEGGSKWIASLLFALDPRDGSAKLDCLTNLGPYTNFTIRLNSCTE